jgi:hypothetical protein
MTDETPLEPPKKKVIGRPFEKGGDPRRKVGGTRYRAESGETITQLARDYSEKGFRRIVEIIEDPETKPRDVVNAVVAIWNRGHGLPSQHHKHEATLQVEHTTIDVTQLTAEVRRQLLEARRQIVPPPLMIEDASFVEVEPKGTDE